MKRYNLIILLTLTGFSGSILAQPQEDACCEPANRVSTCSFNYGSLGGAGCFMPNIGIGRRYYGRHYGWDVSLNLASTYYQNSLYGVVDFIYFPNPHKSCQHYFGVGLSTGVLFIKNEYHSHYNNHRFACPEFDS